MDDIINSFNEYKEVTKQYIDERNQDQQKLIDSHCGRIRENTRKIIVIETEIKPIKKFYNKIADFAVGFIVIIGSIIVGGIYLLKDKLF